MFSGSHGTRHNKDTGDIDVCTESKMLKVKVPIILLGTLGFSLPSQGRYSSVNEGNFWEEPLFVSRLDVRSHRLGN